MNFLIIPISSEWFSPMKIKDPDIMELQQIFEGALSRAQKLDKQEKMRLRRKIRDELFTLLTLEQPTPTGIMSRWEERFEDLFTVMPPGFKEELLNLLIEKTKFPTL